jgi:hypothetical protein
MAAQIILDTLQSLGITVEVIGSDRLRFRPASRIPASLIPRIREAKAEILKALSALPVPSAPSCYEIDLGRGCEMPLPESAEPIVPSRADCGCVGPVCRRCWLCAEVHCR